MVYILNKSLWREGNETVVKTDIGETVLRLERLKRSMRQKIQVFDRYHVPIGTIEKKLFTSGPHFELHYDDRVIATIRKKWSLFGKKLVIRTSENTTFSIKGDTKDYKYTIRKGPIKYADISSQEAPHQHQFNIETKDVKHRYIFICTAIALATLADKK